MQYMTATGDVKLRYCVVSEVRLFDSLIRKHDESLQATKSVKSRPCLISHW
jgi:hypothetical protein